MVQLIEQHAPFMLQIHCVAHRTNLAVEKLGNYSIVKSLKKLCLHLHNYLGKSPKWALQYETLAIELEMEHS
jgi:hypothetical protein